MEKSDIHFLPLSQRPCVVQYLEHYDKFIVGTYELLSTPESARLKLPGWLTLDDHIIKNKLESINNRAGKLILIDGAEDAKTTRIEYELDCEIGGGVFDIKVRYEEISSNYSLHVAHSNGIIGLYMLSLDRGNKISLKEHTMTIGSVMLTSIDLFPNIENSLLPGDVSPHSDRSQSFSPVPGTHSPSWNGGDFHGNRLGARNVFPSSPTHQNLRLVVGDSVGAITVLNKGRQTRIDVSHGDSVWQVKSLKLTSNRYIILIGAENSSWYIYGFEESEDEDRLVILYRNSFKDFSAGVTSITLLDTMHLPEYDLFEILLGSYDETLQMYHVKINQEATSKPDICHKHTLSIDDGGIWRVKPIKKSCGDQEDSHLKSNNFRLCLSAMYAGSYTLTLASFMSACGRLGAGAGDGKISRLVDLDSLKLSEKPLHYDIDVTSSGSVYCIADFNNSLCLIKTINR